MDVASIMQWAFQGLASMLIVVLWAILRDLKLKVEKLDDDVANHKIEAAGKYLTRDEMKNMVETINQTLERHADKVDHRFDRFEQRLLEARRT